MTGDDIDELKRRAYAAEKHEKEQSMVSLMVVSILMAVILVVVAKLNELWIFPVWGAAYLAIRRIRRRP